MYPLYRSWLSRAEAPPPSPLALGHAMPLAVDPLRNPLSLPDVVVAVGEAGSHGGVSAPSHQFAAHRAVLASNSGYFKAALGQEGAVVGAPACVAVSGVTAEAFAPLLGYMYTGYLDIGTDNIYPVLLATHYLHMPRALELCWNFLRAHPPAGTLDAAATGAGALEAAVDASPARSTLVKPIAGLPWRHVASRGPLQPPASHMVLPTAEHSPFRAPFPGVAAPPVAAEPGPPTGTGANSARAYSPVHVTTPSPPPPHGGGAASEDADSSKSGRHGGRPSPQPTTATTPRSPEPAGRTTTPTAPRHAAPTPTTTPASTSSSSSTSTSSSMGVATGKVIVDVACCDGPVQFHRVLNASYGCAVDGGAADQGGDDASATDENQLSQRMLPGAAQLRRARVGRQAEGGGASATAAAAAAENTCHYCNQTFKSHYCYQKHARRHLNPLAPKLGVPLAEARAGLAASVSPSSPSAAASANAAAAATAAATRTPARPLDMNVQYYPCKTCGSKFPSYYFVHKHRKLCHSGEEAEAGATKPAADD